MSAMKQTMQRRYTDRLPREYTVGPVTFIDCRQRPAKLSRHTAHEFVLKAIALKALEATLRSSWSAL